MKITKKGDKIIVELDFFQEGEDTYGDGEWKVNNLVGIIAGEELTISQVNYLDYKDAHQEGMPIIYYDFCADEKEKEDFRKFCEKLGLDVWEHAVCAYCKKVIYGSHTVGKKGAMCFDCEMDKDKTKKT